MALFYSVEIEYEDGNIERIDDSEEFPMPEMTKICKEHIDEEVIFRVYTSKSCGGYGTFEHDVYVNEDGVPTPKMRWVLEDL